MKGLWVTPGFWLLMAAVWLVDPTVLLWTLPAAALHELGHLAALWLVGGRVTCLRLSALGAELRLDGPLSYRRELPVALAGPMVSIAAALLAAGLHGYLFAGLSLALGLFNLLPVYPLDGGRAFRALCALTLPAPWDEGVPRWVGVAAAGLALGAAVAAFLRMGGLFCLLPALWLSFQAVSAQKNT